MPKAFNFVYSLITSMILSLRRHLSMARKRTKQTLTRSTKEFLETYATLEQQLNDTSTPFFLELAKESYGRYLIATRGLRLKLMIDYYKDTQGLLFLKKQSYLVTRNEDGSLDLTGVESAFQETPKELDGILLCQVTSKTVKL